MAEREELASLEDSEPAVDSEGDSDWEEWADEGEGQDVSVEKAVQMVEDADINESETKFWERPSSVKKVVIVYHTLFGNLSIMAEELKKGIESQPGCEAFIYQVPELYPQAFLEKINAAKPKSHPVLTREIIRKFPAADGFLFGMSSRFGSIPAPMKAFFDSTGSLWLKGSLIGKPAGMFSSAATQGGGSEIMAMATLALFAHHGMLFVPTGLTNENSTQDSLAGTSHFGATCVTGLDGIRSPTPAEKAVASKQGGHFARIVKQIA
mmetsp:Transcript_9076/g.27287  ORF Transcript_9076/g.27287 Transcript_9076/m.27287 type:complete len:266 (-) Transcript_9076:45-842(-)|eukprot:CAMPEP_0198736314 /NCGR_PEP_ID=MMETSP1475-20131203/64919_1 /TAXON_ID= ORGANISM="Unidentified sp., Strain CCMP1999" /NCGR_SAMPLE_ID=MMETSP1475 /ASSEMBLY_ACC=CAM_ASM_001111 /LENGTH=265 /DNA_ID=CAMNT_0044500095 /DNA_START=74 /DNA_END=874 /DNA_ORIENTATION=+